MLWLLSAIAATLARTGTHVLNKRLLSGVSPLILTASTSLLVCVIYSPVFLISVQAGHAGVFYWPAYLAALVSGVLNSVAILFLMNAFSKGDVSVAVPLRNIVPVFSMVWAFAFLGEALTPTIVGATALVVLGAVLLHLDKLRLRAGKASYFALMAALMYSFAIIADRFATAYIGPLAYTYLIYLVMAGTLLLSTAASGRFGELRDFLEKRFRKVLLIAIIAATGSVFTFTAISMVPVTVIAPVLRLEGLFSVLAGGYFFHERNLKARVLGALLLFAGVLFIILA